MNCADRGKQGPVSLERLVSRREKCEAVSVSPLATREAVRVRRASVMAAILGDAGIRAKEYVDLWIAGRGAE